MSGGTEGFEASVDAWLGLEGRPGLPWIPEGTRHTLGHPPGGLEARRWGRPSASVSVPTGLALHPSSSDSSTSLASVLAPFFCGRVGRVGSTRVRTTYTLFISYSSIY